MKTTRHSLMAKGILVLLSLLILIFVFTYTWFIPPDTPATASGISASVEATGDYEYAIGFSTSQTGYRYKHTAFTNEVVQNLNLKALQPDGESGVVNLLYDYNPIDVTGNGVRLVRPAMEYGNWKINTASDNYSDAEENVQFISFDLIFRSVVQNTVVKLDAGSFAKGECETNAGDGKLKGAGAGESGVSTESNYSYNYNPLTKSDVPTSNKYGRFSRDAIVGAVRVAFLEYVDHDQTGQDVLSDEQFQEYEEVPKLLWIPRPDIFLNNGATDTSDGTTGVKKDSETSGWDLDMNLSDTARVLASKAQRTNSYRTYQHQYYNIFQTSGSAGIVTYDDAVASVLDTNASGNKVTLGASHDIVTLNHLYDLDDDGVQDEGEYYYGKVRVRIWIEGTDSESRRALAGGNFSVGFQISG